MRYYMFFLALIFSTQGLLAQKTAKLSGQILNPRGEKAYLYKRWVAMGQIKYKAVDSCLLSENASFKLKASVDGTEEVIFYDGFDQFFLLMSPGDKMHLTVNTVFFDETIQFTGKGSKKNNAAKDLYLLKERYLQDERRMADEDELDTIAIFSFQDKWHANYRKLIEDYRNSIPDINLVTDMMVEWTERNRRFFKKMMRRRLAEKPLMYEKVIDFEGVDLNGNRISLSDYKGKVIVVDFWATWCKPCKAEFPAYKELEEKYGNDVHFVSVGIMCKEEAWRKMAREEGFKNNMFISEEEMDQISKYEVNAIPRYFVIDKNFNLINENAPKPSSGDLQNYWK